MVKTIPKHSARPTTLMARLEAEELEKKREQKPWETCMQTWRGTHASSLTSTVKRLKSSSH